MAKFSCNNVALPYFTFGYLSGANIKILKIGDGYVIAARQNSFLSLFSVNFLLYFSLIFKTSFTRNADFVIPQMKSNQGIQRTVQHLFYQFNVSFSMEHAVKQRKDRIVLETIIKLYEICYLKFYFH